MKTTQINYETNVVIQDISDAALLDIHQSLLVRKKKLEKDLALVVKELKERGL